jgi:predicted DNA-binding transcriptional regulator AlpA
MPGYLKTSQAAELLGLMPNTLLEYWKTRDDFPEPVRLNTRVYMWEEAMLLAWRKAHLEIPGVKRRRPRRDAAKSQYLN